ncbi:hypothetical protein KYB31_17810 [Clostridium felsineum]|uniref:hypothetical protein n=1 Tax=Clostridium felsineum TaxID=36839 RepID=UPI00214D8B1E|nr:hypothetical protein [Clostridium felsineum]MCR3760831.1 hypothetical protein [Clostridium felsineum]
MRKNYQKHVDRRIRISKITKVSIPTSIYLYNKEGVSSGFYSEYFPDELEAMGLGHGK